MHLRDNFRKGGPVNQYPASWFNTVSQILNNIQIVNRLGQAVGEVIRTTSGRGWRLVLSTSTFTGVVYCGGRRFTGLGTKAWVRVNVLETVVANMVTDQDGPPPYDSNGRLPEGEEWYEVAGTAGDIHIPRFG